MFNVQRPGLPPINEVYNGVYLMFEIVGSLQRGPRLPPTCPGCDSEKVYDKVEGVKTIIAAGLIIIGRAIGLTFIESPAPPYSIYRDNKKRKPTHFPARAIEKVGTCKSIVSKMVLP